MAQAERPKLSHAGPVEVNREAELKPLPGVGCSDWLNQAAARRSEVFEFMLIEDILCPHEY